LSGAASAGTAGVAAKKSPQGGAPRAGKLPQAWLESIRNGASIYAKKLSITAGQYRVRRKSSVLALSFREMEVLNGLSQGFTREEIADSAGISIGTVKNVISALYTRLGALNRADAIRIAGSAGLIRPS
jgi:LuxR family maltose regulon positive regulatory protein